MPDLTLKKHMFLLLLFVKNTEPFFAAFNGSLHAIFQFTIWSHQHHLSHTNKRIACEICLNWDIYVYGQYYVETFCVCESPLWLSVVGRYSINHQCNTDNKLFHIFLYYKYHTVRSKASEIKIKTDGT